MIWSVKAAGYAVRLSWRMCRQADAALSLDIVVLLRWQSVNCQCCREVMNALWQKIQEMREEHRARHNVYWEEQQAWQKQHQEERRQKCAPR